MRELKRGERGKPTTTPPSLDSVWTRKIISQWLFFSSDCHSCHGITQILAKIEESPLSLRQSKAGSLNSEKTSQTLNLPQSVWWGMHQNETRLDQRSEISDWPYVSSKSRTRRKHLKSKPFRESLEKNRGLAREDTYMRLLRWIASPRSSV